MKKIIILLAILIGFSSCKNDKKQEQNTENTVEEKTEAKDGLVTLKGDFVYYADAAVLQTPNEIYGVVIDETMHKLNEQAKLIKKEPTDMVTVTVKAKIFKKAEGEEGWENNVEIKEIIMVEAPKTNDQNVIKTGE